MCLQFVAHVLPEIDKDDTVRECLGLMRIRIVVQPAGVPNQLAVAHVDNAKFGRSSLLPKLVLDDGN